MVERGERGEGEAAQLQEQIAKLREELQRFVYAVSHDLRAPIRSIDGFALALEEDYGDRVGDEGRDYLTRIRANAKKLNQLLDGLLRISRIGTASFEPQEVDLATLAAQAAAKHPNLSAEIQPGLTSSADPGMMVQLFEILFDNASKFTAGREAPTVEVGRTAEGWFYVRDNGVGFDSSRADKLYVPFEHLHDPREYPGLGVGLAVARKIVERHAGDLRAESDGRSGATFSFHLPAK